MRKIVKEQINGWDVSCQKMPPLRGLALKAKLAKLITPILGHIAPLMRQLEAQQRAKQPDMPADAKVDLKLADLNPEEVAPVLGALFEHIDPTTIPGLVTELLADTSVVRPGDDGALNKIDLCDAGAIDRAFGDVSDRVLFSVVWFSLRTQFADFFGGSVSDRATPPTPKR